MKTNLDRAVEPHENVLIGNFLYMLGLMIGSRAGADIPPGCVNLLQQTPNDKLIGDILAEFHGAVRIIEFKRSTADLSKEKAKLILLEVGLKEKPHLRPVSEAVHWYIETTKPTSAHIDTHVRPYLHLQETSYQEGIILTTFIRNFVDDILSDKVPSSKTRGYIQEYLELLPKVNGSKTTSAGGLIISASKEKGIQYLPTRDFRELGMSLENLHKDYARGRNYGYEIIRERTIAREGLSLEIER